MKRGDVDFLDGAEITFFRDLIEKYLFPIDEDKEEKVSYQHPNYDEIAAKYFNGTCRNALPQL